MSSHHIVREKQEPALLVLGLDNFTDEMLGQLLEWSPTVITTQQTAEKLNAAGIKIDWIITDGEHEVLQSDVKLMSAGNDNLTDAALKYLISYEYPAVNIITDKLDLKDFEHFANQINLVIFNNNRKIFPVCPGFKKWKPAGEIIELFGTVDDVDIQGLEKIGDHKYRTINDGFYTLNFDMPFLFVSEEL